MGRASALILVVAASACGESTAAHDAIPSVDAALPDAPLDADLVNFKFTGSFLDWDSTTTTPCPIVGATWTATYDSSRVATTGADGTFTIALAPYTPLLDISPPSGPTSCTNPASSYALPGIAIATPAVFYAGGTFQARSMTMARVASFYSSIGASFDPTRGALYVHVDGEQRAISISSSHATAQAFDGSTWSAGSVGVGVFFPNIDLGGSMTPMTNVSFVGGAVGTGSVPLAPGAITYMGVIGE